MKRAFRHKPTSKARIAAPAGESRRMLDLQFSRNDRTITGNRPAKPMWISVLMLKSSGFFNARGKPPLPLSGGVL